MESSPNIRQMPSAARTRILLICPDCGQENVEFTDKLRGMSLYACAGEGCEYRFDLMGSPRKNFVQGVAETWRRLCAALGPATWPSAG